MIIDCHCHANTEKLYEQYSRKTNADKSICIRAIESLIKNIDINSTEEAFYELLSNHNNLFGIECVDVGQDITTQLKRIKERINSSEKIVGIKLYPGYQHFYPSDEKLFEVYKFAEEQNKVVVFHNGDVYDPENISKLKYAHPIYIDEIATNFPNTNFVISHLGFPYMMETAMIVNKNPNVFTDISGLIEEGANSKYLTDDIKRILSYYPSLINKLMHGTDFGGDHTPLNITSDYESFVLDNFSNIEAENIFYKTAEKLYSI